MEDRDFPSTGSPPVPMATRVERLKPGSSRSVRLLPHGSGILSPSPITCHSQGMQQEEARIE